MSEPGANPLPYRDTKPVGAPDFYFAINATFRFILKRFGREGLRRYSTDLGRDHMRPVSAAWQQRGLTGVAAYWEAFFKAEPGADVAVTQADDRVVLEVKVCPAIAQLRTGQREIVPCFCEHCYFLGEATAAPAGFTVRVQGGNGSCRQTFYMRDAAPPPQDLTQFREATPAAAAEIPNPKLQMPSKSQ